MRLLVVEDDHLFGSAVTKALTQRGYAVDWIRKGADLAAAMVTHDYDCVLLDLGLPDIAGETLLQRIHARDPGVSVLVVTARGDVQDRVRLLDIGADDYLTKPVDLDELAARLRAVARRSPSDSRVEPNLEHGALVLVPSRRTALWRGEPMTLTSKEYWLLETFVRRKNQVLTRAQLEETLYGWGEEICSNVVEVYVHNLRHKLGNGLIQTVRGFGYQIADADRCR